MLGSSSTQRKNTSSFRSQSKKMPNYKGRGPPPQYKSLAKSKHNHKTNSHGSLNQPSKMNQQHGFSFDQNRNQRSGQTQQSKNQQNQPSSIKRPSSRRVGTHVLKNEMFDATSTQTKHEIDYSKFEKPSSLLREKSQTQVQYEVSSSRAPNLNLSTYGYSVNAIESTRRKAIQDATRSEGVHAVSIRLLYLINKYKSEETILDILTTDYNWTKDMERHTEQREQRDRERNKSRMRIYQRMQEKSKHRKG